MEITIIILILVGLILVVLAFIVGKKIGEMKKEKEWQEILPEHRKDAILRSRAVLTGQFSEQIAPYLPGFNYSPTECRFIGKPVDFIVFKGMDDKKISEVVFVEVKTGKSKLSEQEKNLKEAVKNKKVKWEEYRFL